MQIYLLFGAKNVKKMLIFLHVAYSSQHFLRNGGTVAAGRKQRKPDLPARPPATFV